jgi:hypothetical protein
VTTVNSRVFFGRACRLCRVVSDDACRVRLRCGDVIGRHALRRRNGRVLCHRNTNPSWRVPNDSAAERWHTRLVAAWDHWQRRGHWMTDTTAPHVNVDAPFSVTETQVHTLQAGEGPVVADTAISVTSAN